ncbi:MAG: pyruvate dehydrogenase complex dihydrolipoamide acetyltransferase [Hyphomicrobiaceae bacterium]
MPTPILMPALSPTMEEGKLAKWLVKEGDKVTSGKVIAEIETDKATMEVEAVDEGIVGKIVVPAGTEKVKVNATIAVLLGEGETASDIGKAEAPKSAAPAPAPGNAAAAPAAPASAPAGHAPAASVGGQRLFASPLARRIAKDQAIDLSRVKGSGPHGRIIKKDIEQAAASGSAALGARPAGAPQPGTAVATTSATALQPMAAMADDKILQLYEPGSYDVLPHDGMRRIIAQRLTQSKQTVPHFYLSLECRLDDLLKARERINAASPKDGPRAYKLSVNDFIIKALALALQRVPGANATWTEAGMLRHRHSDVGVAVAIEGGLFTPVIRHAELKTLGEISNEMKDLAERARKRRLAPHEYQGGTTSISNLGMFGIKTFDAVINPPHATILAVGAGEKRPVVTGDRIEVATVMSCTLSCDHRVVDGALGAELLNAFKVLIEDPVRMLV